MRVTLHYRAARASCYTTGLCANARSLTQRAFLVHFNSTDLHYPIYFRSPDFESRSSKQVRRAYPAFSAAQALWRLLQLALSLSRVPYAEGLQFVHHRAHPLCPCLPSLQLACLSSPSAIPPEHLIAVLSSPFAGVSALVCWPHLHRYSPWILISMIGARPTTVDAFLLLLLPLLRHGHLGLGFHSEAAVSHGTVRRFVLQASVRYSANVSDDFPSKPALQRSEQLRSDGHWVVIRPECCPAVFLDVVCLHSTYSKQSASFG